MLRVHSCKGGNYCASSDALALVAPVEGARVWVEVVAPTEDEQRLLRERLGLHELAIEDALRPGQPPKLDDYGDHLFIVAHSSVLGEGGGTRKLALFVSKHWLVTIVRAELALVDDVRKRIEREPQVFFPAPDHLAYELMDWVMSGFETRVDEIIDRVEELEDAALQRPVPAVITRILELRTEHAHFLRTVRSQRDVCSALARSMHPALSRKVQPYLRSMADHTLRLYELLDDVRDNISAARDAYLAVVNNRLSETMRVLTVIATIMMPLTVITGVFGMNFDAIPGLHDPLGFWLTVLGMLAVSCSMLWWFRRRSWL